MTKFPLKTIIYVHRDKESNYDLAEDLKCVTNYEKLTSKEELFMDNFRNIGYEIALEIIIQEDGTVKATSVNGVDLEGPVSI